MRTETLKLDARKNDKFEITSHGFLVADANLTRAGVFDYRDENGNLVRELRPPEEVFKQSSLDSLKFAPITKLHPHEMVDSTNIKQVQVGSVGENIFRRGDFVSSKVVITDKKEVEEILAKWDRGEDIELSMGYDAEVVDTPGSHHSDGHYDKIQTNILYNHGSIVPKGRAGREVKLIMDAEQEVINKSKNLEVKVKFKKKAIDVGGFHMDAISGEVEESPVIEVLDTKLDEAVEIIKGHEDAMTAATKGKDELQAKYDQLESDNKKLKADYDELASPDSPKLQTMIKARADMEEVAGVLEVKTKKEDGSSKETVALRNEIIAAASGGKFDAEGKSEDYLSARYDAVVEMVETAKKEDGNTKLGSFIKTSKKDADVKDPKKEFIKKSDAAWQKSN